MRVGLRTPRYNTFTVEWDQLNFEKQPICRQSDAQKSAFWYFVTWGIIETKANVQAGRFSTDMVTQKRGKGDGQQKDSCPSRCSPAPRLPYQHYWQLLKKQKSCTCLNRIIISNGDKRFDDKIGEHTERVWIKSGSSFFIP